MSPGHLSVHIEGAHPAEIPFQIQQQRKRFGGAFVSALAYHGAIVLLVIIASRLPRSVTPAFLPDKTNDSIIWIAEEGPGGGGGGGGNEMEDPPRQAELPGHDEVTVPAIQQPKEAPPLPKPETPEPDPVALLSIPAVTLASTVDSMPGVLEMPPGPPTISRGSGSGPGAGTGQGSGIGPGQGSGLGPGIGGGTGGGIYQPGNGVSTPVVTHEVKPMYTSEAMRARIQGTVWVECVVRTDGSVGDVEVVRSLDPRFGLDEEAIKAAKQWRFRPGVRLGEPVPVRVTIELTFTLR